MRSPSERLRRTAVSQIPGVATSAAGLELRIQGCANAIGRAMELRRWSRLHSAWEDDEAAIGIAAIGSDIAFDRSRAVDLAAAAGPGRVLIGPKVIASRDIPVWLDLVEVSDTPEPGALEVCWPRLGPGAATSDPASSLLPGPLVDALERPWAMLGRGTELSEVAVSWRRVLGGDRVLQLIAGEPGAGKTRLAAEVALEIHRSGGLVLYGAGAEAEATPFGPFAEAFSHLIATRPELLSPGFAESAFGHLALGREVRASRNGLGGPGADRATLFAAAVEELGYVCEQIPVLLVVDDLHECGVSSLRLLAHLSREIGPRRLMVVATYRPKDLAPADERVGELERMRSLPAARHVELGAIDSQAIRGIAAALGVAGDAVTLDAVASVTARETAGNPFFACEVLRSFEHWSADPRALSERELPDTIRTLIVSRAMALGEPAYAHLGAAAVAGSRFDPAIVARALGVEVAAFAESVALAERAGLVSAIRDGSHLSFNHAVTAHCLYQEIDPVRRGQLHHRLGEVLEVGADLKQSSAQRARHWRRADPPDSERERSAALLAGQRALERRDHEGAVAWFERALELRETTGESAAPGEDAGQLAHCDLLIALGVSLRGSGDGRFREVLLEASRIAGELGDRERLTEAALANNRGFISAIGEFDRERVAMLELGAGEVDPRSAARALILAQLALELTFSDQPERCHQIAAEALAVARECGDRRVLARVLIRQLIARWGPDNAEQRIADATESTAISFTVDEPLDSFHGLYWQAVALVELGRVEEAVRSLNEQRRLASRIGDPTAAWLCECSASMHSALRGNLALAEQTAQRAAEMGHSSAQPDTLPFYASGIASIRWQQGRLEELAPLMVQALDDHPGLPAFRSLLTLAHVLGGDSDAARAVLETDVGSEFALLRKDPTWLPAMITYAHAVAELGDRDAARILNRLIGPYEGLLVTTSISIWGLVDHAQGRLCLLLGEAERGKSLLRGAIDRYGSISAPVWRAQAGLDLAAALSVDGEEGAEGAALKQEARQAAMRHGAGLLGPTKATDAPGSPDGAVGIAIDHLAERIAGLGLTERQVDVLERIAQGLSNQAIADELQISLSTVKRHLENIFDRVGVRGRGALTALLLEARSEDDGQPER